MFIEIRGCGRNWLKLSQSLELFILLILFRENLPQFLWGQEIGVFLKKRRKPASILKLRELKVLAIVKVSANSVRTRGFL